MLPLRRSGGPSLCCVGLLSLSPRYVHIHACCHACGALAVKEPWRHFSCNQPLGQMLLTNQHLDKLAASWVYFEAQGMLDNGMFAMPFSGNSSDTVQETDQDAEDVPGMTTLGDVRLARHPGMCQ